MVERRGSIPEITWEPWDTTKPLGASQPRYSLRNIADGKFDSYIRTWARTLAAYGGEVQLRFAQEMNGDWYPWGRGTNGNTPAEFVKAWRHVHEHLHRRRGDQRAMGLEAPCPGRRASTSRAFGTSTGSA